MKHAGALCALWSCVAVGSTARAESRVTSADATMRAPARRPATNAARHVEAGLRLGVARPFCHGECVPHFGPTARLHLLFPLSRAFKLGLSLGHARFSYLAAGTQARDEASTTSAAFLMRVYPVMGRRAGLLFDLGVGLVDAEPGALHAPSLGLGAAVPVAPVPWLHLAPYVGALFHPAGAESCISTNQSGGTSVCTQLDPGHTGYVSFGLELTALFGH